MAANSKSKGIGLVSSLGRIFAGAWAIVGFRSAKARVDRPALVPGVFSRSESMQMTLQLPGAQHDGTMAAKGDADMLGECFDPKAEWDRYAHWRPHWSQAGAVVFITFRTADSIPADVIERWERERRQWLRQRGKDTDAHWSVVVPTLTPEERFEFHKHFNRCREEFLDSCQGRCLLRRPELAQIVADSLLHFDGQRYQMGDFIVMPNHVHLLAVFWSPDSLKKQCDSWLHYTAFRIHQTIGERGKFWQQEPFDHLVRSPEQYDYLRQYIADNPREAGLKPGEYLYRRLDD